MGVERSNTEPSILVLQLAQYVAKVQAHLGLPANLASPQTLHLSPRGQTGLTLVHQVWPAQCQWLWPLFFILMSKLWAQPEFQPFFSFGLVLDKSLPLPQLPSPKARGVMAGEEPMRCTPAVMGMVVCCGLVAVGWC